jgi:hypothetical protein
MTADLVAEIMYVLSLTKEELIAYDQRMEREIKANQDRRRNEQVRVVDG